MKLISNCSHTVEPFSRTSQSYTGYSLNNGNVSNIIIIHIILGNAMLQLTNEKFMTFMIQTVRARLTIMVTRSSSRKK